MEVYKQGVNNDHNSEYDKGGDVSVRVYLVFRCEKSEIVRSMALANTRENGNGRAVIYTKGIVQYKMPRSAGFCQK